MKKLFWFILLSFAVNVVLAGIYFRRQTSASPSEASGETQNQARKFFAGKHPRDVPQRAAQEKPQASTHTWRDIQSDDLKEFIRRLREVSCPEETVRDIILAEVNRRYAKRTRELWPERNEIQPFWKVQKRDPAEQKKNRERWRKEQEWQKEKSALLVELLGVDPEKEMRKEEGIDEPMDWRERQVAFLPESKRADVLKYLEQWEDKRQEMYERNQGLWDAQSRAEQRELEEERLKGLAQFLTPQELREYELRESQLASQLSNDLRNLDLSREQYEAIFDIRKKYGESIYNYGDMNESKALREQVESNKKALKDDLTAALGVDLVKQYERSQDWSYQELTRLAKRNDLPADTANKVYDFKETAEAVAKQLRDNKTLSEEDRQAALQKVREETERTVKEVLGDKNFKRYQNQGGWWINNLAPAQRPKPPAKPG